MPDEGLLGFLLAFYLESVALGAVDPEAGDRVR
jgi:hypothetical protein